jgi:hypothetical protein
LFTAWPDVSELVAWPPFASVGAPALHFSFAGADWSQPLLSCSQTMYLAPGFSERL